MTYKILKKDGYSELLNGDGEKIAELDHPFKTPDDIIKIILEDMGVGKPQKEAFEIIFTRDWDFVEDAEDNDQS